MRYIAPFLIVFLVGCAALSLADRAYVACAGYESVLSSLAAHKAAGRLTDGMIRTVDAVRPVATGVCTAPEVTAEGLSDLDRALATLIAIKNEVER